LTEQGKLDGSSLKLTILVQKTAIKAFYSYTVVRAAQEAPWKLQRACLTHPSSNLADAYPLP
jgi:hypothetical protein